jgi:hypothetical protein
MIQRLAAKLGESNKTLQSVGKGQEGFLYAYKKHRGKLPPEDRWLVPKTLFNKLMAEAKVKPNSQAAKQAASGFEVPTMNDEFRGLSKRGNKLRDGTRNMSESHRAAQRATERTAASIGDKVALETLYKRNLKRKAKPFEARRSNLERDLFFNKGGR